jgi:hypothetical protein
MLLRRGLLLQEMHGRHQKGTMHAYLLGKAHLGIGAVQVYTTCIHNLVTNRPRTLYTPNICIACH